MADGKHFTVTTTQRWRVVACQPDDPSQPCLTVIIPDGMGRQQVIDALHLLPDQIEHNEIEGPGDYAAVHGSDPEAA